MLLSIVANQGLRFDQLDVEIAFLHRRLDEEIYMDQPRGFEVSRKNGIFCLLKSTCMD